MGGCEKPIKHIFGFRGRESLQDSNLGVKDSRKPNLLAVWVKYLVLKLKYVVFGLLTTVRSIRWLR